MENIPQILPLRYCLCKCTVRLGHDTRKRDELQAVITRQNRNSILTTANRATSTRPSTNSEAWSCVMRRYCYLSTDRTRCILPFSKRPRTDGLTCVLNSTLVSRNCRKSLTLWKVIWLAAMQCSGLWSCKHIIYDEAHQISEPTTTEKQQEDAQALLCVNFSFLEGQDIDSTKAERCKPHLALQIGTQSADLCRR